MIKLIFIRHAETIRNKQKRYLGKTDIALSQKGERQAELISDYLKNENISAIYSSSLTRACQTARIIAKRHSLKVKMDEGLNEIDFGKWEGMTFNQIQKKYPGLAREYLLDPLNIRIPGGESLLKFRNRIKRSLKKILAGEKEKSAIVIVSHGGVNRIIFCSLLALPLSRFWQIRQGIGAINIIEIHKNIRHIRDSGDNEEARDKYISNGVNVISLLNHTLWEN